MKRIFIPAFILLFVSCSGPYLKNRARDLGDIITIEAQTRSYGASVRVGPVQAGLSYKSPKGGSWGLRGGHAGSHHTSEFTAFIFGADYFTAEDLFKEEDEEGKEEPKDMNMPPGFEEYRPDDGPPTKERIEIIELRKKAYAARAPFGTTVSIQKKNHTLKSKEFFAPASYYTQIDISVGLFFGIRIGINPGELLDFILGWAKIDIYNDDEPFPNPVLEKLKANPMWNALDAKTKKQIEKDMNDPQKRQLMESFFQ